MKSKILMQENGARQCDILVNIILNDIIALIISGAFTCYQNFTLMLCRGGANSNNFSFIV